MKPKDHADAADILNRILTGRHLVSMYFRTASLGFGNPGSRDSDVYLRIENLWRVTGKGIDGEHEIQRSHQNWQELAQVVVSLATVPVKRAILGSAHLDLEIAFDDGRSLLIRGYHEEYESWELSSEHYGVVALPGADIAMWGA